MFGEPGDRVAEFVGEPGLLGDLGEDLRVGFAGSRDPIRLKMPNSIARSSALFSS